MKTQVEERFSEFYSKWVSQLEDYLIQILKFSKEMVSESEQRALVSKVTTHYKEYYTVKWAAAHEDVLPFFSPVWLTPLEKAYSWITGWKPSIVFRLVDSVRTTQLAGETLSDEQIRKIEELRLKIKFEEEKMEREMERQQVGLAGRTMMELARLASRVKRGTESASKVDGLVEVAMKSILAGLERVMKGADCVRLKALKGILDVLNPSQSLNFLAATCMLQIHLRQTGIKTEKLYS